MEVLPLLLLLDLLAAHGFRDLFFLLDDVNDLAIAEGVSCAVCARCVRDDVEDGVDALEGLGDEPVLGFG